MKLFGKKTLALILALSMVMSVCVFANETEGGEGGGEGSTTPVAVTGVSLNKTSHTMKVGATVTLTATVEPDNAADPSVVWDSSAPAVATVRDGVVTAVEVGEATITVKTTDGEKIATCAVTVVDNKVTAVALKSGEPTEVNVPYSVPFNASALNSIKLVATYGAAGDEEITATWKLKGETALGAAVGSSATYEPEIPNKADTLTELPTVTVTVVPAALSESVKLDTITVPASASVEQVQALVNAKTAVTVKIQDGVSRTLTVGTELKPWSGEYVANTPNTYTFQTAIKEDNSNYVMNDKTITIDVVSSSSLATDEAVIKKYSESYSITAALKSVINAAVKDKFGVEISGSNVQYAFDTNPSAEAKYGAINASGTYATSLTAEEQATWRETGALTDTFTCTVTYGGVTYTVPVKIQMYSTLYNTSDSFDYKGDTLSTVASKISNRLNAIYGKELYAITFDAIDDDGGALYVSKTSKELVDLNTSYSLSELSGMSYMPNGSGEPTYISYYARTNASGQTQVISGTITLTAGKFLVLNAEIGSNSTLSFNAEDFGALVYNYNDDLEIKYVKFTSLPSTSTDGTLYHEYAAGDSTNTVVSTSGTKSSYYVKPTATGQLKLTEFTFVPKSNASGMKEICFRVYMTNNTSVAGVIRVNVVKEADITVSVGKGQSTALDLNWFYNIVKQHASSSTKKQYEIAYIVFDNAPCTSSEGYLYADDIKLSSPDGDKFYIYNSDDGDYAFDDLIFKAGNTVKTTHATFSVYGRPVNSTSKPVYLVLNRTIDFVVGTSHSIDNAQSPMKAAQVLPFSYELDTFAALGENNNTYIEFTSLPVGGKLYYNYGLPTQEDVTVDTEYYITSTSGKKLLRNITFVPSYSYDKTSKVISFGVKGYNKNNKAVTGMVNISVVHAQYSANFPDIVTSLYADSVDFLFNQGLTKGVPGGKYDAAGQLSRAELVTFLYRAAGEPAVTGTSKFKDVPTTEYYYKAVLWAVQNGITKGTNKEGTLFSPNAKVTNQEIIQFMYNYDVNYLKHTSYVDGAIYYVYDYNLVADWAQVAVKWALGKNVLMPGYLAPTTVGIRGDIALYLHRMLTL